MGLLSNLLLLSCCLAFFRSKKWYSKSDKDATYDAGYNAAYDTAFDYGYEYEYDTYNNAKHSSGYEYQYKYYEDLHTGYECDRDSDCLESGRPKCVSRLCQELSGGVLIIGGLVSGVVSANVAKIGECPVNVTNLPEESTWGAAAVYDNLVYQCGGLTGGVTGYFNKCFIRSSSGQWTEGPSLHDIAHGLTLNKVGSTLVAIGGFGRLYLNSVEILHPGSLTWQLQTYTLSQARSFHCAVTISSTQVILAGGNDGSCLPITEMLNLNTGSSTRYADLPLRLCSPACVLHQGRILLAGGYSSAGKSSQVFTLDYTNQGNSWISTSSMITARYYFPMVVINGVPTAYGGALAETSVEKYEGGVWKSQVFTAPRSSHTSVVIC